MPAAPPRASRTRNAEPVEESEESEESEDTAPVVDFNTIGSEDELAEPTDADLDTAEALLDDEDIDEDDFENLFESLGIDLVFEERPAQSTPSGRTAAPEVPWERLLGGIRESPGKDTRIKIFEGEESGKAKSRAKTMARAIRVRLFKAVPGEEWSVTQRYDGEPTYAVNEQGAKVRINGPAWKVYAMFVRELTDQEVQEKIAKRIAIANRLAAAREAKA